MYTKCISAKRYTIRSLTRNNEELATVLQKMRTQQVFSVKRIAIRRHFLQNVYEH